MYREVVIFITFTLLYFQCYSYGLLSHIQVNKFLFIVVNNGMSADVYLMFWVTMFYLANGQYLWQSNDRHNYFSVFLFRVKITIK